MKNLIAIICSLFLLVTFTSCGNKEKTITIGASPSPHSEILNCEAFKTYVESKGYKLNIKVYQDYVTPNKALNDGGIDMNYFQHMNYLTSEIESKGYKLTAVANVHNEPLNLYCKDTSVTIENKTIYIINDASNVSRAFQLLVSLGFIDTFDTKNFNPLHPVYTTSKNITIQCIDAGLLNQKVNEGGIAIIPGNYALTAWGAEVASSYKVLGESFEVAYPNVIVSRTEDVTSSKVDVVLAALSSNGVKEFIESTYGPTVNYCFKDLR
jgi:D-methionine transport system substrate-binding protein